MNIEDYKQHLKDMSDEEVEELIAEIRKSQATSMSVTRITATKKKTKTKNAKSAISDMTPEEKDKLRQMILEMKDKEEGTEKEEGESNA